MESRENADKTLVCDQITKQGGLTAWVSEKISLLWGTFIALQPVPQGVAADTEELRGYYLVMVVSGQGHMN